MIIDDNYIIKYFFNLNNGNRFNRKRFNEMSIDIEEYLEYKYDNSRSLEETIYRIKHNINEVSICPISGELVTFRNLKLGYLKCKQEYVHQFKSINSSFHDKTVQANIKVIIKDKYGVDNPYNIPWVKEKCIKNCQSKRAKEKRNATNLKRYGNVNPAKCEIVGNKISTILSGKSIDEWSEITEKRKYTYKAKTGYEHALQNPDVINKVNWDESISKRNMTCLNRYGVTSVMQIDDIKDKKDKTQIENFHNKKTKCSVYETKAYEILINAYPDTIHIYKDKIRYPFKCDFYIPSIDTFIELQGHQAHGGHPYNPDSEEDKLICEKLIQLYGTCKTFTEKDPLKRQIAKDNNLNYIEFWSLKEVRQWCHEKIKELQAIDNSEK